MKTLNINSKVRIKLTQFGLKKLEKLHEELRKSFPRLPEFAPPQVDEDGYCEMELWQVMNNFGSDMMLGESVLPFEDNILIAEDQFKEAEG